MTDLDDKFRAISEKLERNTKEILEKAERRSDERMEKTGKIMRTMDKFSMQNFATWRDYLHKYFTTMLILVSGAGLFEVLLQTHNTILVHGVFITLGGIVLGFIAIHFNIYFERKWFQATTYVDQALIYNLNFEEIYGTHPDTNDPIRAARLNLQKKIDKEKKKLREAKKLKVKKVIRDIKFQLRNYKNERGLLKYVGSHVGFIESIWIGTVIISIVTTLTGIILVFSAIL